MRYGYKVIAGAIGNNGGYGSMNAHAVTIHHSAVIRGGNEDGRAIATAYCRYHKNHMPYHFLITRKTSDPIWCTQWVTQFTYHNANYTGNRDCIAICVDGNFQSQDPSPAQLSKLNQLLDDLYHNWFSANGWMAFDKLINPRDKIVHNYQGVKVRTLHWHNEVAQPGHSTSCCGNTLKPYVEQYRNEGYIISAEEEMYKEKYENLQKQHTTLKKKYNDLNTRYNKIAKQLESSKKQATSLTKQLKTLQKDMGALEAELKQEKAKNDTLNTRIQTLESQVKQLQKDIKELKEPQVTSNFLQRFIKWLKKILA